MKNTTSGTSASAANRSTPEWYENAKFGIFIHWGPASVPGWAPKTDMNTLEMIRAKGLIYYFKHNPYAEWYFNSMRIEGSPTQQHHEERWAPAPYEAFGPMFNEMSANLNYEYFTKWADLFQRAGARYVVPVSKHHDGFTLWPAATKKPGWCAQVDLIGKLRSAVLAKGMRMGVYYSGLYDWSWNETGIRNYFTSLVNGRQSPETVGYMDGHVNDLIQRYAPAVLWNDVGYVTHPPWERFSLTGLWDEYYAAVPDGAIDDRWYAVPTPRTIDYVVLTTVSRFFARAGTGWIADLIDKALDKDRPVDGLKLPTSAPHDFRTYEYEVPGEIQSDKWELVRGIGLSFCYNGNEEHDQWLSLPDLTWIFVDVVSKNGNLLLNVGPKADGSLQVHEVVLLEGFGRWMSTYGDALYDSKPWAAIPHDTYLRTSQMAALPVRFTEKDGVLNVFFRANTSGKELFIESVQPAREASVSLWMGTGLPRRPIAWRTHPEGLWVTLPSDLPASPVQCITIDPMPSWNGPKSYAQGGSLGEAR